MFKPLIPIISDVWEHEFNETEHLSVIHEKYGSHHLEKELEESSHDDNHEKNTNTLKSEDQVSFHVLANEYKHPNNSATFDKQFDFLKYLKLPSVFIALKSPPPKFI
jgi:hypothetical protein